MLFKVNSILVKRKIEIITNANSNTIKEAEIEKIEVFDMKDIEVAEKQFISLKKRLLYPYKRFIVVGTKLND